MAAHKHTPVEIVCVAPDVSDAAPTTANTPGLIAGEISCMNWPKPRPATAPRTNSGMNSPHGMGSEIESTVARNLTQKNL
jgi:hypothetical protein